MGKGKQEWLDSRENKAPKGNPLSFGGFISAPSGYTVSYGTPEGEGLGRWVKKNQLGLVQVVKSAYSKTERMSRANFKPPSLKCWALASMVRTS
jgi:hypothetical protein